MCLLLLIYIIIKKCNCIKNNINEGYIDNPILNDSEVIPSFHIKLTCTSETPFDKDKKNYTPFIQKSLNDINLLTPIFQMTECIGESLINCVYPVDIKVSYINETQIAIMFNTKLRSLTFDDGKPQIEEAMSQFKDKQFSVYKNEILFNIDSIEVSNYYDLPLHNYTIVLHCISQTPFNKDEQQYTGLKSFRHRIMSSIKSNKLLSHINKVTECLNDDSIECLYVYQIDISFISETQINIIINTKRRALTFDDGKVQIEYGLRGTHNVGVLNRTFTVESPMDVIFTINSINIESNRNRREVLEESNVPAPAMAARPSSNVPGPAMAARPSSNVPAPAMAARPSSNVPAITSNNTIIQERKSKKRQERKSKRKQERLRLIQERKSKRKQERLRLIQERKSKRKQERKSKRKQERKSKRKQERLRLIQERKNKRRQERLSKRNKVSTPSQ